MSWAAVSPTILPLAGVVVGACGTLLGQHQALRVDARREAAKRASDQRAERKDAVIGFLSATERVEQHRGQLALEPGHHGSDLIELMHAVWLAKKIIELVCSGTVAQAAQDYGHQPCPRANGSFARSSWKQPGENWAMRASRYCGAPAPTRICLTPAIRRHFRAEIDMGQLSGRSRRDGSYPVTITAANTQGGASRSFTIVVFEAAAAAGPRARSCRAGPLS
jgi:hypothetical protein